MSELRTIGRHAMTVLVGQLAVMAYGVTDTIVAGRYSEQALAALSVGAAVYISVFVSLVSVLQALLPVWAELHGGRRERELGRSVRQALYLAMIGMVVGAAVMLFPEPIMRWTQVPETLQAEVSRYLGVLVLALPGAMLFRMFSTLNQSLGKPRLVTMLQALSLLVKIPVTIWFVFGGLGLPAQGAAGCAWATVVVQYLLLGVALWLVRTQDMYRPYAIWQRMEPPDWRTIGDFARLGVPAGLTVLVEVTSFTLMALFIARQGATAVAAHQVVSNLAAVMYMVPLSLGIATSARASYWLGTGDPKRARAAVRAGLKLGLGIALGLACTVLLARWQLAAVYSTNTDVVALSAGLIALLAVFHLGDATQGLCVFVLRSYRVTVAPLIAYCVLLWGVGLGGGYMLAYVGIGPWPARHTPQAFWLAATVALAIVAPILAAILWRAARSYRPLATAPATPAR